MQKNLLLTALRKMHDLATQAIMPDFNLDGRVTVVSEKKKLIFLSSNGHLEGRYTITSEQDPNVSSAETGKFTTDAVKFRDAVSRMMTEDESSLIEISSTNELVTIRDISSKRKKLVRLPIDPSHHELTFRKPSKAPTSVFEADQFIKAAHTVSPFMSKAGFRIRYQVVMLHWIKDEVRFVCGDGMLFSIYTLKKHTHDEINTELQYFIPVAQMLVIAKLMDLANQIEMTWNERKSVYLKSADMGLELCLKGIPEVKYIEYQNNAFRFDEAKAIADVKTEDMAEGSNMVGVLKDKEKIEQGKFHKCLIIAPSSDGFMEFRITNKQSKFQCEYEVPAQYYDVGKSYFEGHFEATWAHLFLELPIKASCRSHLRYYFINEKVINVASVDLLEERDENNLPRIREVADEPKLSFLFANVDNDDDDEESNE